MAGTNGEGPSLSAPEKRDLLAVAAPLRGKLDLVLGIATPSLDEATWLCKRAADHGAACLVMPPGYFRNVSETGIRDWFLRLLDASPAPILAYNFPKMTGVVLSPELLRALAGHPRMAGIKDSSGERENLTAYAQVLPGHAKYVGDETLLVDALECGWSGTISGASNVIPEWTSAIVGDWTAGQSESARAKFDLALPAIEAIRAGPQPVLNKALLHRLGILERPDPRLPLEPPPEERVAQVLDVLLVRLGVRPR